VSVGGGLSFSGVVKAAKLGTGGIALEPLGRFMKEEGEDEVGRSGLKLGEFWSCIVGLSMLGFCICVAFELISVVRVVTTTLRSRVVGLEEEENVGEITGNVCGTVSLREGDVWLLLGGSFVGMLTIKATGGLVNARRLLKGEVVVGRKDVEGLGSVGRPEGLTKTVALEAVGVFARVGRLVGVTEPVELVRLGKRKDSLVGLVGIMRGLIGLFGHLRVAEGDDDAWLGEDAARLTAAEWLGGEWTITIGGGGSKGLWWGMWRWEGLAESVGRGWKSGSIFLSFRLRGGFRKGKVLAWFNT
jgi:hypothetical protein